MVKFVVGSRRSTARKSQGQLSDTLLTYYLVSPKVGYGRTKDILPQSPESSLRVRAGLCASLAGRMARNLRQS